MHGIEEIKKLNGEYPEERPFDEVGAIMDFESGELDDEGIVELFQHLVDNGHAWILQGFYGRMATALIKSGHVIKR